MSECMNQKKSLTAAQRAKTERNRQKALLLRQAKLMQRPDSDGHKSSTYTCSQPRSLDTGGGFFFEEDEDGNEEDIDSPSPKKKSLQLVEHPAPLLFSDRLLCSECQREFQDSYLFNNFDEPVCDSCKSENNKFELMTRTKAKDEFLLKDADLDKREPLLKFIVRRNPHNQRWGDMKLYLHSQVYSRAMTVWGSEEKLEEQKATKDTNKEKMKQKKFDKKVKELRHAVRSSLWKKDLGNHEHTYGEESYNEDDDMYSKTCSDCGHVLTYEKM